MDRTYRIEELLDEAGWLRRLAAGLVGDGQAEDLVQDAWLAALRHPPRARRAARPWLQSVLRNRARNVGRDRARREERERSAHEERTSAAPAELAEQAEAWRLLAEAVTRLDEPLRAVIVLHYFQGLESRAVGARLGLSASAVRTRLQRALAALRADLDERVEGGRASWAAWLVPWIGEPRPAAPGASAFPVAAPTFATALGTWSAVTAVCALVGVGALRWFSADDEHAAARSVALAVAPLAQQSELAAEATLYASADRAGRSAGMAVAATSAPLELAELSGTVLVDGRPPAWPLVLTLEPRVALAPSPLERGRLPRTRGAPLALELAPAARGAFAFRELARGWSGRLAVHGYAFADGTLSLDVAAPTTDLVVDLRSGPEVVGRLRDARGLPVAQLVGMARIFGVGPDGARSEVATERFACRDDGAFRIPIASAWERTTLFLAVEDERAGYLRHETPAFVTSHGLDLGELTLEALHALAFRVRDTRGAPLEGAFARVDGPSFRRRAPLTGPDGRGVLALAPEREVFVRFSAFGHADRVLRVAPGDAPDVELRPLAVLEVRFEGERTQRLRVSADASVFAGWTASGVDEDFGVQLAQGGVRPLARRMDGARHEYEFALDARELVRLVDPAPGLRLTLEALDGEGRVLDAGEIALAAEERATLVLGRAARLEASSLEPARSR